jgi:hypothetical protein
VAGREDAEFLSEKCPVFHTVPYDAEYARKSREGAYPTGGLFDASVSELSKKIFLSYRGKY